MNRELLGIICIVLGLLVWLFYHMAALADPGPPDTGASPQQVPSEVEYIQGSDNH